MQQSSIDANMVVTLFDVTSATRHQHARWLSTNQTVVDVVMHHQARTVLQIEPGEIENICRMTARNLDEHALGTVDRAVAESVPEIVNWRPDFAFTHVFHYTVEEMGKVPTWQEFREFAVSDEEVRRMLTNPASAKLEEASRLGYPESAAKDAMQWRVGNSFYSFLREMYTVSILRSYGLDVCIHPLADALFRVDAWLGRTVLNLYVGNNRYRDGRDGRKIRPQDLLRQARPAFGFLDIRLKAPTEYGRVHLPDHVEIDRIAQRLASTE